MNSSQSSDSLPPRSVNPLLLRFCQRLWPALKTATQERQVLGVGEVISTLYAAPFAIAGIIWLIAATDWVWLKDNFVLFALFGILIFAFNQFYLFYVLQTPFPLVTLATLSFFIFDVSKKSKNRLTFLCD